MPVTLSRQPNLKNKLYIDKELYFCMFEIRLTIVAILYMFLNK